MQCGLTSSFYSGSRHSLGSPQMDALSKPTPRVGEYSSGPIVSSPNWVIPISVMAFADNVTYFSSTNSDYPIRVSRGNAFAAFFGLTLNYKKSFYAYANTSLHHTWADVYSQETKSYTSSTVIPPGQPIRILGGWMSITMNWNRGKLMIRNNLLHYYDTLKNKDLTTS